MLSTNETSQGYVRIHLLLEELQENQELLQRKNRRLGKLYSQAHEFVDNVSHEFRTPLTVIKEYVALVREGAVGEINDEQSQLLTVVEDRADDLNIMVDDMLDISKIESGTMGVWRKRCSLQEIVDRIRVSLERKSAVQSVELCWEIEEGLPEIYCDTDKIGRVIINLAINAIKFCNDPGRVRIRACRDVANNNVEISVVDNGPGIDRESLATIFERFKQLGQGGRGSTHGFGLGLNIAKELIDINLGTLDVQSAVGFGTTFSFTIPMADPIEAASRYLTLLRSQPHVVAASHVTVMILEVDQEESQCADQVDAFVNGCLRRNDLCFRVEDSRWLLMLPEREADVEAFMGRMARELEITNRSRPDRHLAEIKHSIRRTWRLSDADEEIMEFVESLTCRAGVSQ